MKITTGWISNSSSSSFLLMCPEIKEREDIEDLFSKKIEGNSKQRKQIKTLNTLLSSIKDKDEREDLMWSILLNNPAFGKVYVENGKIVPRYKIKQKQIIDILWNNFKNDKITDEEILSPIDYEELNIKNRTLYEMDKFISNLRDNPKKTFLYKCLFNTISNKMDDCHILGNDTDLFNRNYKTLREANDWEKEPRIDEIAENLALKTIENIISEYEENDFKVYFIRLATDEDNASEIDYLGRGRHLFESSDNVIAEEIF